MRMVEPEYLEGERALARAVEDGDARAVHAGMAELGYLPAPDTFDPERVLEQLRLTGEWYFEPGPRRFTPAYVSDLMERSSSPRSEYFDDLRRMSLPPQALLIRRMEGLVFSTLGELRARADWAALGREYHADAAPQTAIGHADAKFWRSRGLSRPSARPAPRLAA
jgi:hypothetical protein